ncbi:MAG TPA: hypothetical protein VGD58_03370 [Herpetosiphonaceae bacterium]
MDRHYSLRRFLNCWCIYLISVLSLVACGVPAPEPGQAAAEPHVDASQPMTAKPDPSPEPPEPLDPANIVSGQSNPSPAAIPTVSAAETVGWQTYRDDTAGYSVRYPPSWTVHKTVGNDGSPMALFGPTADGSGITVLVQAGVLEMVEGVDLPNSRCTPITINGLPAQRCFDTLAMSLSTTIAAGDKLYIITASGKQQDTSIYEGFLQSFIHLP